jgi:predicted GIY-YIG superfamily endonuclease
MKENNELRENISILLKRNGYLPVAKWETFPLIREKSNDEDVNIISEIKKNVRNRNGLYIYKKNRTTLYVGKGNPIANRLISHSVKESKGLHDGAVHKNQVWYDFFEKHHPPKVTIYWKEVKAKNEQKVLEAMLSYALRPEFEHFREQWKASKGAQQ